jgi:Domain of unknown function (DUF4352)
MAFCSNCGQQIEGQANYCATCGAKQQSTTRPTISPAIAPIVRVVEPKRAGRLALLGFVAVIGMIVIFDFLNGGHSSSIGTGVASGIGAVIIILTLVKWRRNSEVIRGQSIAACVGILFLLSCLGSLLGSPATNANAGNTTSTSKTESATPEIRHFAMRETVHVGYWSYAVWSSKWQNSIGSGFMSERPDAAFLVINMTVRNNDKTSSTLPPIKLVDSQGREYDSTSKGSFSEGFFGPLKSLNPGVESEGSVAFDVPKGDYLLKVSGGFTSGENGLVELQ